MRNILGLIIGLYLTVAIAVLGGGIYGFMAQKSRHNATCEADWIPYVALRAAIWPKAYWDHKDTMNGLAEWLTVQYDPEPSECSWP
jgi:hypothetical protein